MCSPLGRASASLAVESALNDADVLRFFALLSRADVELDALTLVERAIALTLNRREVDEHIRLVFPSDEPVALLRAEPLHSARSHISPASSAGRSVVTSR